MLPIPWPRISTVVFDVDGTLYDPRPVRREMALALLGHLALRPWRWRLPLALERFRRERERLAGEGAVGISRLQYERPAAALGITPERMEALVREWMLERPLPSVAAAAYPGLTATVDALRAAGRRIAVWSDYPAAGKLAVLGLEVELVVTAVDPDVDRLKPDPRGLEVALERLGTSPEHCLLIGDRDDRDGEAARRAGVEWRLKAREPSEDPRAFTAFDELLAGLE